MKTIPRIIEEQVQRWQIMQKEGKEEKEGVSIVTVSREAARVSAFAVN